MNKIDNMFKKGVQSYKQTKTVKKVSRATPLRTVSSMVIDIKSLPTWESKMKEWGIKQ